MGKLSIKSSKKVALRKRSLGQRSQELKETNLQGDSNLLMIIIMPNDIFININQIHRNNHIILYRFSWLRFVLLIHINTNSIFITNKSFEYRVSNEKLRIKKTTVYLSLLYHLLLTHLLFLLSFFLLLLLFYLG